MTTRLLLVLAILLVTGAPLAAAQDYLLEVAAGENPRQRSVVTCELPDALRESQQFSLKDVESGNPVAVQRLDGQPPRIAWLLDNRLAAGATRSYRLSANGDAEPSNTVCCNDDGKRLQLKVRDRTLLEYNIATVESPPGVPTFYRRSGYLHPLFSPTGAMVSDDFAPDHVHQHGVFFAWVSTEFEGRKVDFWNQAKQQGDVEHVELVSTTNGPVCGGFTAKLRHLDRSAPDGAKTVLEELWTIRAYNRSDIFVFDLESRQECVADFPLQILEYHYGGMGLRGSRQWYAAGKDGKESAASAVGQFLTSEGKHRIDGNHSRPNWVSLHGPIGDGYSTLTVMSCPANFRSPQPVRLHPTKPYFCFAPMVLGEFEIKPGEPYVSRYRFCIYDGPPDTARNEALWADFADPPAVTLSATP